MVEDRTAEVFELTEAEREAKIVVTATWHGFNVEAKEALLEALSLSKKVTAFVLVGPVKKDYGSINKVLAFFEAWDCKIRPAHDDTVNLAGHTTILF